MTSSLTSKKKSHRRKNNNSGKKYRIIKIYQPIKKGSILRNKIKGNITLYWVLAISFSHSNKTWTKKKSRFLIISSIMERSTMRKHLKMYFLRIQRIKQNLSKPIFIMIMRKNSLRRNT